MNYTEYRKDAYQRNCELIDKIADMEDPSDVHSNIEDVIRNELDLDIRNLLDCYRNSDIDGLFLSLTGWNMETIMAKAKVIPCLDGSIERYPDEEITFPLWGRELLTKEDFMAHLNREFTVSKEATLMIENAFSQAGKFFDNNEARRKFLLGFLDGAVDVDESIVSKLVW